MFLKLKKELISSKNKKLKKRNLRKISIKQSNMSYLKFGVLNYFLKKQNIFINNKMLRNILITENGTISSLKNWVWFFYTKKY